ncbi:MAG: MFS transporter [Candidatus Eremiobacteraeota bacterium]|nr:MFS transporter [Candidatus Eremiobacteraeota bacterium]
MSTSTRGLSSIARGLVQGSALQGTLITLGLVLAAFIDRATATATGLVQPWIQGDFALSGDEAPAIQFSYYGGLYFGILLGPWLLARFGRPRYLALSVAIFGISTLFCAISSSMPELAVYRVIQGMAEGGFFLGSLVTLFTNVPMSIVPLVILVYAAVSQCGSALAPLLAGAVIENHSWRLLYLALAIAALIAAGMITLSVGETPLDVKLREGLRKKSIDRIGVFLLAVCISAYCYLAAFGELHDWLGNQDVAMVCVVFSLAVVAFVLWERFGTRVPIVPIDILTHRNALLGTALALAIGFPLFGISLHVSYMREVLNFPLQTAGATIALRAVALIVSAPLGSALTLKGVDSRLIIASGFALSTLAFVWEAAGITSGSDFRTFVGPELLIGVGFGLTYGPLLVTVLSNLPFAQLPYAIAGMNLSYVAAGSFANSWLVTVFDHRNAQHLSDLAATTTLANAAVSAAAQSHGSTGVAQLASVVGQQSAVLAFADAALCAGAVVAIAVPFSLFLKRAQPIAPH